MNGFQLISLAGLGGTVLAIALHFVIARPRRGAPSAREPRDVPRLTRWERLVHAVLLLAFLVLLATSGWPTLRGERMSGYFLMVHTVAGAVFAVALVAMMITWAADARFQATDVAWLRRQKVISEGPDGAPAGRFDPIEKAYFWTAGILGLATLISTMLSMVPLFGTVGQTVLYEIHRYAALLLVMATVVHLYRTTLAKPGTLGILSTGRVSQAWANHHHALWWQQRSASRRGGTRA